MVLPEPFVGFLFRIINFAVFIILMWYLFNKYFLQSIYEQIAQKKAALHSFGNEQRLLRQEKKQIEQWIMHDIQEQEKLKKMVNQWQDGVKKRLHLLQKEKKDRMKIVQDRMIYRSKQIQSARMYKKVLPKALHTVQVILEKDFIDTDAGKSFVTKIIDYMQTKEQ